MELILESPVGILLPLRGRYEFMLKSLESLAASSGSERMELVVVVDNDKKAFEIAFEFLTDNYDFKEYSLSFSHERIFSVAAFNHALRHCASDFFIWVSNSLLYERDWFLRTTKKFAEEFSDGVGVLAIGGKVNKANFGMTSKKFVEYNDGEWFSDAYRMNFCDDELACRAILLGRYSFLSESGVLLHTDVIEKDLLYDDLDEKIGMKKSDRQRFYERSATNFGLSDEKIYKWEGFRRVVLPLKGIEI